MSDSVKAYTCSSPGCNMSFTDEDHLTVHKKKHDMVLNLGNNNKNTAFIADQTPTPTKFIRNCEEVGLFQDLQNVNPFEETFRRAVEAGNTGTLIASETGMTDDTLHTPHIFPHIADVLSTNSQMLGENNVDVCSGTMEVPDKCSDKNSINDNVCTTMKLNSDDTSILSKNEKDESIKGQTLMLTEAIEQDTNLSGVPKINTPQTSPRLSINGEEVQLLLKTADGKLMQLAAIPFSESTNSNNVVTPPQKQPTVVIQTEPSLKCAVNADSKKPTIPRLSLVKMKLKQILRKNTGHENQKQCEPKNNTVVPSRKENRTKMIDQRHKKEIQERNRASSMRARAKRKAWIQQLERTVTNVNETNVALQMEVKALRAEVAKLKTLLLAHKDCPVTKAMQKGNGIILGPKIISVNPEVMTLPISVNTAASTTIKRTLTTDASSIPKKKLILSPAKNPIIFPKIDTAIATTVQNTIMKTLPTLKIMGVSQYLTEKEETKQILVVQNHSKKIGDVSPRQIIQINPNYEIDHAASKTTGA